MKFIPLLHAAGTAGSSAEPVPDAPSGGTVPADADLLADYRGGRGIGPARLGARWLFVKKFLTAYYLPYGDLTRYFRRVEVVPAKIGCCAGDVYVENAVLCGIPAGDSAERELAQLRLPGERAGLALMAELRRLAPDAAEGRPAASADPVQSDGGGIRKDGNPSRKGPIRAGGEP